ncbi:hypothetical protein KIPB_012907, partial [Kipferlia bialata]
LREWVHVLAHDVCLLILVTALKS